MSQNQDIADEKQRLGEHDGPHKSQPDIFVNSTALIGDGRVIPIYSVLESKSSQLIYAWVCVIVTTIFCAWTISFAYDVFISPKPVPHAYNFSPQKTVAMVNAAAHISVLLTGTLVGAVFDALCWALISNPKGTSLRTYLATERGTGILSVGKLFLTYGAHQLWCILRFIIMAIGWVVGLLLLSHISYKNVYYLGEPVPVIAGLAHIHETVTALERTNSIGDTPTFQETSVNMMVMSSTNSILTDPKFATSVKPISCKETDSDCKSLLFPGGLELVLRADGNSLFTGNQPNDSVIIVHDAPGYQIEFFSQDYTFNYDTDCQVYGTAVSSLYSCTALSNQTFFSGITICPLKLMENATCISDKSWTKPLDAQVAMNLYQRTATVAYDKTNFSILSIESIGDPQNAADETLVSDFRNLSQIMYPQFPKVLTALEGDITSLNLDKAEEDLGYLASAYCVQSEITAAQFFLQNGYPNWITGQRDILEGFLAIPVQFGTLLWQQSDKKTLPPSLNRKATWAQVSFRVRSETWTLITFGVLIFSLILWAILCLLYVHLMRSREVEQEHSTTIQAAFENGNPFDVKTEGFGGSLGGWLSRMRGKLAAAPQTPAGGGSKVEVVARAVSHNILIVVDRSEG